MKQLLLFIVFLGLIGCKQSIPAQYSSSTTEVNEQYKADSDIQEFIEPYKDSLDAQMNEVIGSFAHEMVKAKPESALGNFMSDAMQTYYNALYGGNSPADFAFTNYGGIRLQHIPAGEFTVESMFELMPFENEVVAVEIPGNVVQELFERFANDNGWPVSDNLRLTIANQQLISATINGEPVDPEKTYTVLTSDYVANGGDGMDMLTDLTKKRVGIKLRDLFIAYAEWKQEQGEEIHAPITGRIIDNSK